MRKDLTPLHRERLIIALQVHDAIDHVNKALAARKGELILDYTDKTMLKLCISMPGVDGKPITLPWLCANPRHFGKCHGYWPADPDLYAMVNDIMQRLASIHAYLAIGVVVHHVTKVKTGKLQCFFNEAKRTAITMCEVAKGTKKATTKFEPPKEFQK